MSHGEAYLPHDKGNGAAVTRLTSNKSGYLLSGFDQSTTSQDVSRILGSLSTSADSMYSVKFELHSYIPPNTLGQHVLLDYLCCCTCTSVCPTRKFSFAMK